MILLILYLISVIGCFVAMSLLSYCDKGKLTVGMLLFVSIVSLVPMLNSIMFIGLLYVGLINYVIIKYDDFFSKVVIEKKD